MIYIASDHAGFKLKQFLIARLRGQGKDVEDCGAFSYDKLDDYPDFIFPCAQKVAAALSAAALGEHRGIVIGYSGQGEAMAANKVKGIRAAVYYGGPEEIISLSREHNDANILSLGAGFLTEGQAAKAVDAWLAKAFSGEERHARRIKKMEEFEK